jgi:hypothetical protein
MVSNRLLIMVMTTMVLEVRVHQSQFLRLLLLRIPLGALLGPNLRGKLQIRHP